MLLTPESDRVLRDKLVSEVPNRWAHSEILKRRRPGYNPPRVQGGGGGGVSGVGGGVDVGGIGLSGPSSPLVNGGGMAPGVDLQQLEITPVSLYGFTLATDVNGAEIGPFAGPVVVRWVSLGVTVGLTSNDHDALWRVDFSSIRGRDTFTFVSSGFPVERSSAPYTLFNRTVDYGGAGAGSNLAMPGWISARPAIASDHRFFPNLAVNIPLSSFYVKAYFSNDNASSQGWQVVLGISSYSIAAPLGGGLVVGGYDLVLNPPLESPGLPSVPVLPPEEPSSVGARSYFFGSSYRPG